MIRLLSIVLPGSLLFLLAACSAPSPVLYPNAKLNESGQVEAQRNIEECKQLASAGGADPASGQVARSVGNTAIGGATGGTSGAVGGAILGAAGRGAAVGAATGATAGFIRSIFSSPKPSGAYINFVDRCLRERGYEPIGWD